MMRCVLQVNGLRRSLIVDPEHSLAEVLRRQLLLTGCKVGCNQGQCGACTVLLNGRAVRSCVVKMRSVSPEASVTTIEGLGTPLDPHPLQLAWMASGAVQCGFCSPGFILSAKALLDTNPDPTREQVRDWFHSHRNACRCTGYRPLVDAVIRAAKVLRGELRKDDLQVKTARSEIAGMPFRRTLDLAKVAGTCDYGADLGLHLPAEVLRLALVQSDQAHARILSVDVSAAAAMPGVVRVILATDLRGTNRIASDFGERPILCDEKTFQYGDAIAVVAADTEAHARSAAKKAVVIYEPLPAYLDASEALSPEALNIHEAIPNEFLTYAVAKGRNAAEVLMEAQAVGEAEFYCSRQPHLTIECDSGFAYFDGQGRLVIHSKSSVPSRHGDLIAEGLGLGRDRLILEANPSGGSFGYKQSPTVEALLGAACLATGRPVSLAYSMFQNITYTGKRAPSYVKLRLGADAKGRLLALEGDWTVDQGAYSESANLLAARIAGFLGAGYSIPNLSCTGRSVTTNHVWGSPFRAFGAPQAFLAMECLMDELAETLGLDPFEFRYRNIYRPGATTPAGGPPDVFCLESMFSALRPRYEEARRRCREARSEGKLHGVGFALGVYHAARLDPPADNSAPPMPPTAAYELFMPEVEVDPVTGRTKVRRFTTLVDVGTIVNRTELEGQILGGLAQGIGLALSEEFEDVQAHSSLVGCGLPYVHDVPDDIEILFSVTPRPHGLYGAADGHEIALTASHAAVINALYDAVGVRIRALPARPEKVLAALALRGAR